jgi:hypothetical protein
MLLIDAQGIKELDTVRTRRRTMGRRKMKITTWRKNDDHLVQDVTTTVDQEVVTAVPDVHQLIRMVR